MNYEVVEPRTRELHWFCESWFKRSSHEGTTGLNYPNFENSGGTYTTASHHTPPLLYPRYHITSHESHYRYQKGAIGIWKYKYGKKIKQDLPSFDAVYLSI
jgi:hypothetical protein